MVFEIQEIGDLFSEIWSHTIYHALCVYVCEISTIIIYNVGEIPPGLKIICYVDKLIELIADIVHCHAE